LDLPSSVKAERVEKTVKVVKKKKKVNGKETLKYNRNVLCKYCKVEKVLFVLKLTGRYCSLLKVKVMVKL
jgi:hypothetical protein